MYILRKIYPYKLDKIIYKCFNSQRSVSGFGYSKVKRKLGFYLMLLNFTEPPIMLSIAVSIIYAFIIIIINLLTYILKSEISFVCEISKSILLSFDKYYSVFSALEIKKVSPLFLHTKI